MAKALVTGGSGYFGEILSELLLARGWDVYILDLNSSTKIPLKKQFVGDIRNFELCTAATKGMDAVFHNVAQVPLAKNGKLFYSVNVDGTANILKAASDSGVSNFVYTSSSAVFGLPRNLPIRKDSSTDPIEKYGDAKLRGENLCVGYFNSKMKIKIVRPRTILGASRMGIFALLYNWIQAGVDVYLLGKGDGPYQFVHADDLAEGVVRSIDTSGDRIFNLGALDFSSFKADLASLCNHAGTGSRIRSIPDFPFRTLLKVLSKVRVLPFAPYQMLLYGKPMYFDSVSDWKELGYAPKHSNVSCLTTGYDWYLLNKDFCVKDASKHKSSVKSTALTFATLLLKIIKKFS